MARSTDTILEQAERLVPYYDTSLRPLTAAIAAALSEAETQAEALAGEALFGGSGQWLRLHAHGYGVQPAQGESDASLRARLRRVEDAVTPPAIVAAVDAIITPLTCTLVEWWDTPYLDVDAYLDMPGVYLSGGPNTFLVVVPAGVSDATLDIIVNEVNRLRAAGIRWALVRTA